MKHTGRKAFHILIAGQTVSVLGTRMTQFALLVWAYEQIGTATALALLGFFVTLAFVAACPIAGMLVDRWDRRKVIVWADIGAGLMTGLLLMLFTLGRLRIWHLYLLQGISGALGAFQNPASAAAITLLVPKETLTRSNALIGLGRSATQILAPALAGLLMQIGGLGLVMIADLATMAIALLGLLLIEIPAPPPSSEGRRAAGALGHQLLFGMRYILARPGLRAILGIFFLINLFATITYFGVLSPMILARTGGNELQLGLVRTLMGVGGILGGLVLTRWRGPRRKARLYLTSTAVCFLSGDLMMGLSKGLAGWSIAGTWTEFTIPFVISPYYALWQEIVPPDVQGRVFSARETIQILSQPAGYLIAGALADHVFEPALQEGGALTASVGKLVGTGPGAGMSAMFLCTALLGGLTGLVGFLSPSIRRLDDGSGVEYAPVAEAPANGVISEEPQAPV